MDLDSTSAPPVEMCHRRFLAQTHGVVDPLQVAVSQFTDLPIEPLNPPLLGRRLHQPPVLVPLHTLPRQNRVALLERCDAQLRDRGRPLFCALLESDAPDRVRNHLMREMAPLQPGVGRVLFRVHDARVFRHLRWLLDPAQMVKLMGPISAWTWHEPLGNTWRTHLRPAIEVMPGFTLRHDQWRTLTDIACINGCLRDLAEEQPGHASALLPTLLECIDEARGMGLREAADLGLYALHRLDHGKEFAGQEAVKLRLQRVQQRGMSYRMACKLEQWPCQGVEAA